MNELRILKSFAVSRKCWWCPYPRELVRIDVVKCDGKQQLLVRGCSKARPDDTCRRCVDFLGREILAETGNPFGSYPAKWITATGAETTILKPEGLIEEEQK